MTEETRPPGAEAGERGGGLDEFRALVRTAFERAQSSGKSDWTEMTSAVLKNRILDLTSRQFSEERYGSPSFIHLVRRIPDLLDVIEDRPPFRLRIRVTAEQTEYGQPFSRRVEPDAAADLITPPARDWRRTRIRDDLWRAIIDYDSGTIYVFDTNTGLARPREVTDRDLPELPTAGPAEVATWRQDFVSQVAHSLESVREDELRAWAEGAGRQTDLPRVVRGRWAEFIKKNVVRKLSAWFDSQSQRPPADMLIDSETHDLPRSDAIEDVVRTRRLRDLVIRAVRSMTYEELARVPLPSEVVLRVTGKTTEPDG